MPHSSEILDALCHTAMHELTMNVISSEINVNNGP